MQHTFTCMFDGCEQSFLSLKGFKKHITEDHKDDDTEQSDEIQSPLNNANEQKSKLDDDSDDESTTDCEEEIESGYVDQSDVDTKESNLTLDEKEQSALNALLMLSENKKPKVRQSESIGNSPNTKPALIQLETSINNIPVIPLLSPKSPKSPTFRKKKYPAASPVVMGTNESSAKFYTSSPKISNLTRKALNSPQRPHQTKSNAKIIGKKRKLSEMDADGLAHLVLKLQDKISEMAQNMKTTQKQLVVVKKLYRKKARLTKN